MNNQYDISNFQPENKIMIDFNFKHEHRTYLLILLRSILLFLEQRIHHSSGSKPVSSSESYRDETIHRLFAFVKIQMFYLGSKTWLIPRLKFFYLWFTSKVVNRLVGFISSSRIKVKYWAELKLWKRVLCCWYFFFTFNFKMTIF